MANKGVLVCTTSSVIRLRAVPKTPIIDERVIKKSIPAGSNSCKFQVPWIFGCTTVHQLLKSMFSNIESRSNIQHSSRHDFRMLRPTRSTTAAWMNPCIGGNDTLHLLRVERSMVRSLISQTGACTRAPDASSSSMKRSDCFELSLDRDSRSKNRAPQLTIHFAICWPIPPRPPDIT